MRFSCYYDSDIGSEKAMNQDALCFMQAQSKYGNICLAAVCDGMGGLDKGELASASVIKKLRDWFYHEGKSLILSDSYCIDDIRKSLNTLLIKTNQLLNEYGKKHHCILGTTLTLIYLDQSDYCMFHIGDSRMYQIRKEIVTCLSDDHSVVNRLYKQGKISKEQMGYHEKRHVLTQCIGTNKQIEPQWIKGKIKVNDGYLLCSDGFWHELNDEDYLDIIKAQDELISSVIKSKISLVKNKGEKDNITCCLVKVKG